jgi:hypothetical protein
MSTSSVATETAAAKNVRVTDRALVVELRDGRVVSVPATSVALEGYEAEAPGLLGRFPQARFVWDKLLDAMANMDTVRSRWKRRPDG